MEVGAIASGAMAMQTLQFQQSYAIAVTQKVMDTQELAGQELVRMLPQQPQQPQQPVAGSRHLDVYA